MNSLFSTGTASAHTVPNDLFALGGRGISLIEFLAVEEDRTTRPDPTSSLPSIDPEFLANERAVQVRTMIDAARADAHAEGALEAREECLAQYEDQLSEQRLRVEKLAMEFALDRQRYFAAAEAQVVRLALAIARRVLMREVVADELHLAATVRAALARVHDGKETLLRVHSQHAGAWEALFATGLDARVRVVADDRLKFGETVLETNVGRVELGVEVQLDEIERGFSDLTHRQGD